MLTNKQIKEHTIFVYLILILHNVMEYNNAVFPQSIHDTQPLANRTKVKEGVAASSKVR